MKNIRHLMLGAALSLMTAITMAQPVELSGIKFDSPIELRGTKLELNGAGIRYKVVVKVYAAGLYLTKKASTLEEVLAAPGPKRMAITVLRDVDSAELGKLLALGHPPVLLCAPRLRPHLFFLAERSIPGLVVLSYAELIPEAEVQSRGVVRIDP